MIRKKDLLRRISELECTVFDLKESGGDLVADVKIFNACHKTAIESIVSHFGLEFQKVEPTPSGWKLVQVEEDDD